MVEELPKALLPGPVVVVMVTGPSKVPGLAKEMLAEAAVAFVVVIAAPKDTVPPPVCDTGPFALIVFARVKRPVLSKATGPRFVVLIAPVISKMVPVKEMPVDVVVVMVPAIVVVPLPAV